LSKLFDQLKEAAREREGGILLDALARKQKAPGSAAQAELPLPQAAAERLREAPEPPAGEPAAAGRGPASAMASRPVAPSRSSLAGIALAVAIFALVFFAWEAAPWRAPQKLRIEPESLKLDRTLDLQRAPSKGTTAPSRPS